MIARHEHILHKPKATLWGNLLWSFQSYQNYMNWELFNKALFVYSTGLQAEVAFYMHNLLHVRFNLVPAMAFSAEPRYSIFLASQRFGIWTWNVHCLH